MCPPDGTISLGNTCQKDKTTKHENIYNKQAESALCPSRQYSSTIYLGNMVQRDKTNII